MDQSPSSKHRALQSYPYTMYNNSTSNEIFPSRHRTTLIGSENLKESHDVEALPNPAGSSISPDPFTLNADCGTNDFQNNNFFLGNHIENYGSISWWDANWPEQEFQWGPVEEQFPADITNSQWFGLRSNANFPQSSSSLDISENGNISTDLSVLFNEGNLHHGIEEFESINLLGGNSLLPAPTFAESSTTNIVPSESAPYVAPSDYQNFFSSQLHKANNTIQNFNYRDQPFSVGNMPSSNRSSNSAWHQIEDQRIQHDFLHELLPARLPQFVNATNLPAMTLASPSTHELPSFSHPEEVSPSYTENLFSGVTFSLREGLSFPWDSRKYDTLHNPYELSSDYLSQNGMSETESTYAVKPASTIEADIHSESTNWQNILSTDLKAHEKFRDVKQGRKVGRRHGRLKPEIAKNAQEVRRVRACLPCAMLKMSCTPGDVCKRCSVSNPPSLGKKICTRAHLEDLRDLFFPGRFVSHFGKVSVQTLFRELSLGFAKKSFEVDFTCGYGYLPMRLAVVEYFPKTDQTSHVLAIATQSADVISSVEYQTPPPAPLSCEDINLLESCRKHIKQVVAYERNAPGTTPKSSHKINILVIQAITRYYGLSSSSKNTSMLDKAMMLHAIYYFMDTTLTIANASNGSINEHLVKPARQSYDSNLVSRLLNRQIKSAMHNFRYQLMGQVLEELEKELKTRTKVVWVPCFCVALILCMCIEGAQIAMDAFATHTRLQGAKIDAPSSQATIESCRKLDDLLFNQILELFHVIYKSRQFSKARNGGRVYNPIRDGPEIDEELDCKSANLITEIREILASHEKLWKERESRRLGMNTTVWLNTWHFAKRIQRDLFQRF